MTILTYIPWNVAPNGSCNLKHLFLSKLGWLTCMWLCMWYYWQCLRKWLYKCWLLGGSIPRTNCSAQAWPGEILWDTPHVISPRESGNWWFNWINKFNIRSSKLRRWIMHLRASVGMLSIYILSFLNYSLWRPAGRHGLRRGGHCHICFIGINAVLWPIQPLHKAITKNRKTQNPHHIRQKVRIVWMRNDIFINWINKQFIYYLNK